MKSKGYLLVLSTAVISGIAIFVNQYGVAVVNSDIFTFLKNAAVAVMLTGLIFFGRQWNELKALSAKQWLQLLAIGLIGGSAPFILFFKGLSIAGPLSASVIHKTMFIWTFFFAWLFLKEKIGKNLLVAGGTLLAANLVLLKLSSFKISVSLLLILGATLLWSLENTISKHALKTIQPRLIMWGRMFIGAVFIFVYLAATKQTTLIYSLSAKQVGWTLVSAVILFGYVGTWYSGLKRVSLSEASVILMFGAPITAFLNGVAQGNFSPGVYASIAISILAIPMIFYWDKEKILLKDERY